MLDIQKHAKALATRLPEALIVQHAGKGLLIHRFKGLVSIPTFEVSRGYILAEEGEAPNFEPPMTEEQELEANVDAMVRYHRQLHEHSMAVTSGPLRTLIHIGASDHPESRLCVGMWVY